ncbi:MAG: hypothetical protein IJ566_01365, partial [Cardiobacteriaceae bacterium]|nr:hypothetical protein [Cardiobacteriaceae bacterium]
VIALRSALIARNKDEALTLLDILSLDYRVEEAIRKALEKDDFTAALNELNEEHNDERWGEVRKPFNSRNECEQERRRLNRARPDLPTLHCEKLGVVWVLLP